MNSNNENPKKRKLFGLDIENPKTPYKIFGFVFSIWLLCWFIVGNVPSLEDWSERGQFGDMFGTVNALFSGLAFAGIIYTILLQREELEAQRHELQLTRKEFKTQNVTLKRQRFETTFFNMLSLHLDTLRSLEINPNDRGIEVFRSILDSFQPRIKYMLEYDPLNYPKYCELYQQLSVYVTPILSPYLQSLVALHRLILQYSTKEKTRKKYFSLLDSYISMQERRFMFYHILFSDRTGVNIGLTFLESDLGLLETVPLNILLHPSHRRFMSHY